MKKDIRISIAAGEALLFLENSLGSISVERLVQFIKNTRLNVYLILHELVSEKSIFISRNEEGETVVQLSRPTPHTDFKSSEDDVRVGVL